MPGFPFPGLPAASTDEPLLDMIIARRALPPDAPQPMHDLALMLAALAGPAEPGELAAEAAVRAAFSRAASPGGIPAATRPAARAAPEDHTVPSGFGLRLFPGLRLATAAVVAVAGLGSVFAAYVDVLPSPIEATGARHGGGAGPPGSSRSGLSGPARRRPRTPRSSTGSQPAPGPHHSASPARGLLASRPPRRPSSPARPGDPGRTAAGPSCGPGLVHSPSPQPKASGQPSPLPSWSQGEHCTGIPTGPGTCPR